MTARTRPLAEVAAAAVFEVPPLMVPARVERAFIEREVARGERLSGRALALELGVNRSHTTQTLAHLRALRRRDPELCELRTWFAAIQRMTTAELAEAAEQARTKHIDVIEAGAWWQAAACGGMDTELFFPPTGARAQALRAKRVCAACPVRLECLRAELAAPVPCGSVGIVGGLAPPERTALRTAAGVVGYTPGRFLADQALTWRAHQRARRVGITQAAAELGTDTATLRRAFDRHGLPVVPAQPRQWRFATREQAAEAYELAVRVGIMAAARTFGSCNGRLREAFARFDLPWPPPPRPARASVINPHHGQRVEPVFFVLNPAVWVPARLARQAGARVRRAEEFEVLGARVVHALGDENQARRAGRARVVARRARDAGWPEPGTYGRAVPRAGPGLGRPAGTGPSRWDRDAPPRRDRDRDEDGRRDRAAAGLGPGPGRGPGGVGGISAAAVPPEVRELLAAVLEALSIPFPATVGDHARYSELLEERAMHARLALERALEPGGAPLGLAWEVGYPRQRLAEHPPTGYHTGPWPGVPVDQADQAD